jgi:hypothetical protein
MKDCRSATQLPEAGSRYWVQCEHSWHIAVVDEDGTWKSFSNGKALPDVLNFASLPMNGSTPRTKPSTGTLRQSSFLQGLGQRGLLNPQRLVAG